MEHPFFAKPILNSPYAYPPAQWVPDETGQATHDVHPTRRTATFITPIPRAKKHSGAERPVDLDLAHGVSDGDQRYHSAIINGVRAEVDVWRSLPNTGDGGVCPETAIGLTEAAPNRGKVGQEFLDHVQSASDQAKPGLLRLALQLATVAGKTTVMAMLKAWQTVNAARRATSKKHTRGFVLVAPSLAIKDRLQVLLPNGVERDDKSREPIPSAMVGDLGRAKIVITKHHAFTLREPVCDAARLGRRGAGAVQSRRGKRWSTRKSMKRAIFLLHRNHLPGVAFRVFMESMGNSPLAIIPRTSAPWQYALSPIPRVCRTPGAFSFLAHAVSGVQK